MPRSKFFKAESMMATSIEADFRVADSVADSASKSIEVVHDDEKIVSIRQFFPETWIWSIEKTE